MTKYAREFMQKIELGQQPYLVYRHFDTIHPHVHLVCPKVGYDGARINVGKKFLMHAHAVSREIETTYCLVKQEIIQKWEHEKQEQSRAQKIIYGESSTKPALARVLETVMSTYQYTSLGEFNAALKLYNVQVAPAQNKLKTYKYKGLYYRVLDEQSGKGIGTPIMASHFNSKPTLKNLEKQFVMHASARQQNLSRLQSSITAPIDWTLRTKSYDLPGLIRALQKERITVVPERDKQGVLQRIYYIDHGTKAVFEGAALGPDYTAAAMLRRCPELTEAQKLAQQETLIKRELLRPSEQPSEQPSQQQKPNRGLY